MAFTWNIPDTSASTQATAPRLLPVSPGFDWAVFEASLAGVILAALGMLAIAVGLCGSLAYLYR